MTGFPNQRGTRNIFTTLAPPPGSNRNFPSPIPCCLPLFTATIGLPLRTGPKKKRHFSRLFLFHQTAGPAVVGIGRKYKVKPVFAVLHRCSFSAIEVATFEPDDSRLVHGERSCTRLGKTVVSIGAIWGQHERAFWQKFVRTIAVFGGRTAVFAKHQFGCAGSAFLGKHKSGQKKTEGKKENVLFHCDMLFLWERRLERLYS